MSAAVCGRETCFLRAALRCFSLFPLTPLYLSFIRLLQQVRGSLARLRSCVENLRSIPQEGCIIGTTRAGEMLLQAVLDSLQQFERFMRHTSTTSNNTTVEVSVHMQSRLKRENVDVIQEVLTIVQLCEHHFTCVCY